MTNEDLEAIGFQKIPYSTVASSIVYDLGRNRQLSASAIGTPNEMLWISELGGSNSTQVTDLVCLHNYDYDKELTIQKVQTLIDTINNHPKK